MISLVTGVGAKGQVGEAVAAALQARGDTVVIVSRSADEVSARAAELGGNVRGFPCDLSDPSSVDKLASAVRREYGEKLDALVNLAGGFGSSGPLASSDPAATRKQIEINFTTAYLATRAFLPMVVAASGSIVFFASESVIEGSKTSGVAGYAASKAAVVALMRSVAEEGREAGVRANALAPGAIRTATNEASMGAAARYVERGDVASAVLFLCSPASRAISGQLIRLR